MEKGPLVQIGRNKVLVSYSSDRLVKAKEQFRQRNWIKLKDLIEIGLLKKILKKLDYEEFYEFFHDDIGENCELRLKEGLVNSSFDFLLNNRELFSIIEEITECLPIDRFVARVYRFEPFSQNFDQWHDDDSQDRLLALTLNLSEAAYKGGNLELRKKHSPEDVQKIFNLNLGDAILFRIGPDMEHRVTGVMGDQAKTAYAGWFCARPDVDKPESL